MLRDAERFVLAPRAEPIPWRVEAEGWVRDAATAYCPRCGSTVGPGEVTASGCASCRGGVLAYDGVVRLGRYAPPIDGWVTAAKFGPMHGYAAALGAMLGEAVRERLGAGAGDAEGVEVVVVPMPTPWTRRLSRGVDHSRQLALGVAKRLGVRVVPALRASRHGPQHELTGPERRSRDLSGVFRRRRGVSLEGATVVLVDDVLTTGRTARAAGLALTGRADLRHGAGRGTPGRLLLAVVGVADGPAGS
jgi:predicted amidophosphoribosyltransferase